MSIDILKTIAILDSSEYLLGADRMARATESVGKAAGLERLSGGMMLAGGLLVGLEVKAIKAASQFQQLNQSLDTLYGKATGDKLFGDLKQYNFSVPYVTTDLADNARLLGNFGVTAKDLIPTLKDLGDAVTAAYGVDPAKLKQASFALGEMNEQYVSLRQARMLVSAGIPEMDYLQKYLHLNQDQMSNLGKLHIPGKYGVAATRLAIEEDPARHNAQAKFMETLAGQASNLNEAWTQFLANAGSGALAPVSHAIKAVADELKKLSAPGASGALGTAILYGGPALLAAGPLMRAIGLWKQISAAKNLATVAANVERQSEIAKLPILAQEGAALEVTATKWQGFAASVGAAASKLLTFAKNAGKAYLAYAALNTVKELSEMGNPAQHDREQFKTDYDAFRQNRLAAISDSAANPGRTMTYGWKADSSQQNFERYQAEAKRLIEADKSPEGMAAFQRSKPEIDRIIKNWANIPNETVIKMAEHLNTLVNNADDYKDSGQAGFDAQQKASEDANRRTLAGFDPGKYHKPPASEIDHLNVGEDRAETLMRIAELQYQQAHKGSHEKWDKSHVKGPHGKGGFVDEQSEAYKNYNKYRTQAIGLIDREVAALGHHAAAIQNVAGKAKEWLTTEKKMLELMGKKQELADNKLDKHTGFDKYIATIVSGTGLSEQEILKRTGIGRHFFQSLHGKSSLAADPALALISKAANTPVHINVQIGGKTTETIVVQVKNAVVGELARRLGNSGGGGLLRN